MRRKLQTWQIMRLIFPEVLSEYFEIVNCEEKDSRLDFWMDERELLEREDYTLWCKWQAAGYSLLLSCSVADVAWQMWHEGV